MLRLIFITVLLLLSVSCDNNNSIPQTTDGAGKSDGSLTILATGAKIAGANGILFSPDGDLYIASVIGSNITVINPDTGKILRSLGESEGIVGPDDLAFSSDGTLYWTSILTGEVGAMNVEGEKFTAAQLSPGVNPITFSDDGRLFVSQCFFGVNLYEIDPKGEAEARLISDELGPGCGLNGMDWGPDNRLYGPRWFTGEVVSFDVIDNTMRVEASGFSTPAAVKFNSKGILHVLDTGSGEVISIEAGKKKIVASLSLGLDNLAFDENDRLFVSSFTDGSVQRVEADSSLTQLLPGGLSHPGGITLLGNRLVVADFHAIRFFDKNTGEQTEIQRNVLGTGKMGGAINIEVDGKNLILVSWIDNDVRVWDPIAKIVVEQYKDLGGPVAAIRFGADIIATTRSEVLLLNDSGSRTLFSLPSPSGLALEGDDLYLTDRESGSIYKIGHNGKILEEPLLITTGLDAPEGLVVSKEGFTVIEARTGNVVSINAAGEKVVLAKISGGSVASSSVQPASMIFNGITIDEEGILFMTGETSRILYKL